MIPILLFFIIGQAINAGTAYWILWGIDILFWIIKMVCETLKTVLKIKEEI